MLETKPFTHSESNSLALTLVKELSVNRSLNEFLERIFPAIRNTFGASRMILVDYREQSLTYHILHYDGYPIDSLYQLNEQLETRFQISRAHRDKGFYHAGDGGTTLSIPLYFSDVLEAVLFLEADQPLEITDSRKEAAGIVSRILGLLMSSTRLVANRDQLLDLRDAQRAREIQLSFLPSTFPSHPSYELYGLNISSSHVGGDYLDYFEDSEQAVRCILADACGHGMSAALIMSNFRGLLQSEIRGRRDLPEMFSSLNHSIHFDSDLIQYLTTVFLDFDAQGKTLRYLNAGHFDPVVIGADGNSRVLTGGGPPLGMFRASQYPVGSTRMNSGELVVLFTDGLAESSNPTGEEFGRQRILETVQAHRSRTLEEISERVVGAAHQFSEGRVQEDDITLFLMRIL